MKVFLSWSGTLSHKVALVFRDWIKQVIQEIEPYVSSEDIDKGARWSTDIAQELSNSEFGILCVTKDNIDAPWLVFEAGALSKTMDKSSVCPFLFDIKRSEVDGPILQFQSTIFEKDDVRKLIKSLHKKCVNNKLTETQLSEAFDVWFPRLEEKLLELRSELHAPEDSEDPQKPQQNSIQVILEEMLELTRMNQKLLRSSDGRMEAITVEVNRNLIALQEKTSLALSEAMPRDHIFNLDRDSKITARILDALPSGIVGAKMCASLLRETYPWLYSIAFNVFEIIESRLDQSQKKEATKSFQSIFHITMSSKIFMQTQKDRENLQMVYYKLMSYLPDFVIDYELPF